MYISKLVLNPRLKEVRRDIANAYEMHSTFCRVFSAPDKQCPAGFFLWRLEPVRVQADSVVLVQSLVEPNWSAIGVQGYMQYVQTKPYLILGQLRAGQRLRFRLKANPTVTRPLQAGGKSKRHTLRTPNDQLSWLQRQARKGGFAVSDAMVTSSERLHFSRRRSEKPIVVGAVTFDGALEVKDPERLSATIASGVGHAKALGLGMLSIALQG